ncbi:uncharacterized protein LOC125039273 [Penaeus chinensis]|uniref:uncharacterized protein LOC125039273 n=1 Tax=Penaeus chinensis TaxID=139456 RepID=UPI001FB6E45D|nr:uncharacterized protein LOC125039273 [Penaeus chinensis]
MLTWGSLENIASIQLRVRPKFYDTETSCPALNISEIDWPLMNHTEVDIPISRGHGSIITYQCIDEYMLATSVEGQSSSHGELVCTSAGTWNPSVTLPCKLTCPTDFFKSENKKACYKFLTSASTFGIESAALQCSNFNASLAVNFETNDMSDASSAFYYTGYTERIPTYQEAVTPLGEPDASFNASWYLVSHSLYSDKGLLYASYGLCPDGNCFQASSSPSCMLVTNTGEVKTDNCSVSTNLPMCMVPARCPPHFVKYRGICYLFRAHEADITGALKACTLKGASLAFPKDMDTLMSIVNMVEVD